MKFEIIISLTIYGVWHQGKSNFKIYFLSNQWEYRDCLTHFVSLLSAEWYCSVCFKVWSNTEAGNSVKQTPSMLHLNAYGRAYQNKKKLWKVLSLTKCKAWNHFKFSAPAIITLRKVIVTRNYTSSLINKSMTYYQHKSTRPIV